MRVRKLRALLALGLLIHAPVGAQPAEPAAALATPEIPELPHASGDIVVDGVLDEEIWMHALVIPLKWETNPGENIPAPVDTFAYLVENGAQLLVAFDAHDPNPDEIRGYLRDRDASYNDDFVGVVLDTFNDQRRAFEFFVNPLGAQMDLTMDDVNGNESDSWDAIWDSAGRIDGHGFIVEIAIPFSQLRFSNTGGEQIWGLDALRFYPRTDRSRISNNKQERGRNCYLCQLSKIRGFQAAEPGKDLEVVPSITGSRTDTRDEAAGGLVSGDPDYEAGLNLSWGITPDMTANIAVNPDFSQVEADVAELDVNNQFAIFYPEKRPFFLEGADYFSTPINAVFTRTVADPDFGAKLTGSGSSNTYGVFAAKDAVTNLLFPGPLGSSSDSLERSNKAFVGRYRRSYGAASTVGALVTSRSATDYSNDLAGIDGRVRIGDQHSVRYQYLHSQTQYPDDVVTAFDQPSGAFSGDALQVNYDYSVRNWFAFANYRDMDPGFRADSGFVSQVDVEQRFAGFGHVWHGDGGQWWNRLQVNVNGGGTYDTHGQRLNKNAQANFSFQGPLQSFAQIGFAQGQEFYDNRLYDITRAFMYGQFRPRGGLNISMSLSSGDQIDYANSRLGDDLRIQSSVDWNANRHLLVRMRLTSEQLDAKSGESIFDATLADVRLTWQFNIRSFVRLTLQHQDVDRNAALYTDPSTNARSTSRATQLLYSYKLNPQTVVFAGYSDNAIENDDLPSLTPTQRTFFLKFSYAWIP